MSLRDGGVHEPTFTIHEPTYPSISCCWGENGEVLLMVMADSCSRQLQSTVAVEVAEPLAHGV